MILLVCFSAYEFEFLIAVFSSSFFLPFFKVASCFLVMEPRTRISRGFAFVTMETVEDANRCIKHLNQSVLEGRYITVEKVMQLVHLLVYDEMFSLLFSSWLVGFLVIFRTPSISYIGSNQRWSVHPCQLKWNSLISGQIKQLLKRIWSTKHSNYIVQQLYNLRHSLSTFN